MVLLAVLRELAEPEDWKLCVAHFNHQLRGRASDADERLVQRTAQKYGLPFVAGRGDVKALAAAQGASIEMAARELRHEFLAQTAQRLKCPVLAVAHHSDDQVELFFLRLLRGAGGEGAAGMKESSRSPASKSVQIVRPLLEVSKAGLREFAREHKVRFREDDTNAARDLLRNRVRHELLPLLRRDFQPALNRTVLRMMELIGGDAAIVTGLAKDWLAKFPKGARWSKLAIGLQRRVIQLQLQRLKVAADFELVEWLRLQPEKMAVAPAQKHVIREASGRIRLVSVKLTAFSYAKRKLNLKTEAGVSFGGLDLTWNLAAPAGGGRPKLVAQCEFFDAAKVGGQVILRHWQPGDRFQPIGMKAAVKLQDWFTNQKIPAARRRELVLATTVRGDIFWVEGLRIGERFKITTNTKKILEWRWLIRS